MLASAGRIVVDKTNPQTTLSLALTLLFVAGWLLYIFAIVYRRRYKLVAPTEPQNPPVTTAENR